MSAVTPVPLPPVAAVDRDAPPVASVEPLLLTLHGDRRSDPYRWLRDRDDPRTLAYLKAENDYTAAWFAPRAALRERLYQEMFGRLKQDDEGVPYRRGAWWYASRVVEGRQYPVFFRRAAQGPDRHWDASAPEQVLLDLNAMAEGKAYLALDTVAVSPDSRWLAYSIDRTGGLDYTLRVRAIESGTELPFEVEQVAGAAWANDNRTLYYVTMDASKRANQVWRRDVDSAGPAQLLYEERDPLYSLGVARARDGRYVYVSADSRETSEVRLYDADRPRARGRVLLRRKAGVEYEVEHRGAHFYLRLNDTERQFRVVRIDETARDLSQAVDIVPGRPDTMIDDFDVFARHLVLTERVQGALQLRVLDLAADELGGVQHRVAFDEAAYAVAAGTNPEFDAPTYRFLYESMTTPPSTYDLDLKTEERVLRKRQPVLGGYDPARYASERVMARAADGTEVPISLVWRRDLRREGPQPLLLYGYGAYGLPTDPWFSSPRVSLLDRGVIFAVAHVRGGGDLGRPWYDAGKMGHKMTSFTDFVTCAQWLVDHRYTQPSMLAIEGGSAGGLLVTAAVNLRPELFRAVVAEVPFVDVINTMLDTTVPLTIGEFLEWGNPKRREQYEWMRAYSPYDNLKPGAFPAMFVRTGLNDSQVQYWEPAKYVARLRSVRTDRAPLLLHTDLDVGHGGASGRFDSLRESAEIYTFLLDQLGVAP